jgi:hypothetical protein
MFSFINRCNISFLPGASPAASAASEILQLMKYTKKIASKREITPREWENISKAAFDEMMIDESFITFFIQKRETIFKQNFFEALQRIFWNLTKTISLSLTLLVM